MFTNNRNPKQKKRRCASALVALVLLLSGCVIHEAPTPDEIQAYANAYRPAPQPEATPAPMPTPEQAAPAPQAMDDSKRVGLLEEAQRDKGFLEAQLATTNQVLEVIHDAPDVNSYHDNLQQAIADFDMAIATLDTAEHASIPENQTNAINAAKDVVNNFCSRKAILSAFYTIGVFVGVAREPGPNSADWLAFAQYSENGIETMCGMPKLNMTTKLYGMSDEQLQHRFSPPRHHRRIRPPRQTTPPNGFRWS